MRPYEFNTNNLFPGKEAAVRRQIGKRIRKRYIIVYLYLLLVLMTLLTVASYTWFSLSQTPRVSDLYMFVNAEAGLELSLTPDAEEWELQLDFRDMVDVTPPLRPVTWSDREQRFYAANYGIDGRLTGQWEPLNDDRHANKDNLDGYYIKATFYARSGQPVTVSLTPAIEVDDGIQGSGTYLIGYPQWDSEEIVHNDAGQGAQSAMRLGFRITPMDAAGQPTGEESVFYIYEPNMDQHTGDRSAADPGAYGSEYLLEGVDSVPGYIPTPSIDGTDSLVDESRLILQTSSSWTEADPVERSVVIHELGQFVTDPYLFALEGDDMVRIDLYVWLEGQDADCTNVISQAQIMASVQFRGDAGEHSGMQPIQPEEPNPNE